MLESSYWESYEDSQEITDQNANGTTFDELHHQFASDDRINQQEFTALKQQYNADKNIITQALRDERMCLTVELKLLTDMDASAEELGNPSNMALVMAISRLEDLPLKEKVFDMMNAPSNLELILAMEGVIGTHLEGKLFEAMQNPTNRDLLKVITKVSDTSLQEEAFNALQNPTALELAKVLHWVENHQLKSRVSALMEAQNTQNIEYT